MRDVIRALDKLYPQYPALRAEFDDCDVSVGPGTTTLRAGLLDQSALQGLLQRISGLGLELIEVRGGRTPVLPLAFKVIRAARGGYPVGDRPLAALFAVVRSL